uniref:Uncharacterized protein n=1 Tax=Oryza sativa subsp. japonica TaxID=39947 RepID=Q84YQ8_ORYSJ|nr:hypothetical protein [Oryza sativa Japonica Group]
MVPPAKRAVPSRSCEAGAACSSVPVIQSHGTDTVPRSTTFLLAHSSPPNGCRPFSTRYRHCAAHPPSVTDMASNPAHPRRA